MKDRKTSSSDPVTSPPSASPWSDLPPELLAQIGQWLLKSPVDILRFRAVCSSWRSSLSLPFFGNPENRPLLSPNLPIKISPFPFLSQSELNLFSVAGNSSFYLTTIGSFLLHPINGSPYGNSCSLLTVDELNSGNICFREPLSGLYKSTWSKKSSSVSLDFLRFHVSIVGEHLVIRHLCVRQNASENAVAGEVLEPSSFDKELSAKVVLLTNLSLVVALFQDGKLGVLGLKDMGWKMIHDGAAFQYDDIVKVSCENLVYGVDRDGGVYVIRVNPESGSIDQFPFASPIVGCSNRRKRLVVDSSSERLFLVENRCVKSRLTFFVYELKLRWENLDKGLQKWEKIKNLEDQIIFVDFHISLCASAQDFHALARNCSANIPRNCIFFIRGSFPNYAGLDYDEKLFFQGPGTHMNVGIFCLADDHAVGLLEPGYEALILPPITWFLPQPSSS